ncbi:MAG: glycosyltransferase [Clostridia bacterium]|nr:glycosyltransferase [Clostridia bacterium]
MKISVALAAYNGEKYIAEQIESILSCLREGDELIVSDDNPRGKTKDAVSAFSDSRIHYIEGPGLGVCKNFENALSHCSGDVIFLSDQDDVWLPGKTGKAIEAFEQGADLILHNARITDSNLNDSGQTAFDLYRPSADYAKNLLRNGFVGCCMAFSRKVLSSVIPFPGDIPMHDWWIAQVCLKKGFKVSLIEEPLLLWRRHGETVTGRATSLKEKIRFRIKMIGCLKTVCHGKDQ